VAVVGTRHPTAGGRKLARALAADLARAGIAVISGGASGIDAAAHEGALSAGGATVVVAPSGFERPFPPENAGLFERVVAEGGAYLALFPDPQPALRSGFFARNACLAALCHALVVVEAPLRSGARNAAKHARSLGRRVFAVPHSPWNSAGRGCNLELRAGAKLAESAADILPHLAGMQAPGAADVQLELQGMSELSDARAVAGAVRAGATTTEAVCAVSGVPPARVQAVLLSLSLAGVVRVDAAGVIEPA
jgi:DNA processing protein